MLDAAFSALGQVLDPATLLMLLVGVLAGLVMGIIPGIGGTGAVAVLLPFVLLLEPPQAMAMIIGAVAVVHTSDTISSVLLGIPGSAAATVMLQDGHTMAKQGQAARALSIAFTASIFGGLLGALGLTLSIPLARPLVLLFASPELFMLTVLGVALTALLSKGNMLKGVIAGLLGILLGQVGAAPTAADYRFTFGQLELNEGLNLVAVALGVFGIAEIVHLITKRGAVSSVEGLGGGWRIGARDVLRHFPHVLRGSLVGIWAGVLPGVGATAGSWMAYGQAVSTAKNKKKFGKGDPRGIIAPESAAHSIEAGDLIPTLLFGIPGAAPAALLMGALLTFGIETGPSLINDHLDLVYTIIWAFAIATVVGAGLCLIGSVPLAKLCRVPFPILGAGLIVLLFVSAYQEPQQFGVLQVMLLLGVVGWLMKVTGMPRAPFLIGFVLSIPMERYYFLTDSLFAPQDWLIRPAVLVMLAILILPFVFAVRRFVLRRRAAGRPTGQADETNVVAATPDAGEATLARTAVMPVIAGISLVVFGGALAMTAGLSAQAALMPRITCVAGVVAAVVLLARELLVARRDGYERIDWKDGIRPTVVSLLWIVGFLALVVLFGTIIAVVVFIPTFLRAIVRWSWWKIAIYLVVVLTFLLALRGFADIALPVGYLTPPPLR
ncbi:MAG: hypothetical protein GEV10_23035 [Streptosporangiales bacterium]|nr:hypothetical protein [Streptosporangiales bacterium]